MKQSLIYRLSFLLIILHSCNTKELLELNTPISDQNPITFTAQPMGYIHSLATRAQGDVTPNKFDEEDESRIYNAYFLLFDGATTSSDAQRVLRVCSLAEVANYNQVTYTLGRELINYDISDAIVCFLANVSLSDISAFNVGTTTWEDFKNAELSITYSTVSSTATIGVPYMDINGDGSKETPCLPMFATRKIGDNSSILLERLFARVEIHVSLDITEDSGILSGLTSKPQFRMLDCVLKNIPKRVPIVSNNSVTNCSSLDASQANSLLLGGGDDEESEIKNPKDNTYRLLDRYNLSSDSNLTIYNDDSAKSIYLYVPEHKLGNQSDSNIENIPSNKPLLISGNERAIYATISGILVDGEGVSYNAAYNIYLGADATSNFDLRRNLLYKNYVRIKGVENSDTDHRVVLNEIESNINALDKEGRASNCYIIGAANKTYMIPAYRGAFSSLENGTMCDFGVDEVIACDNNNIKVTIDEELSKQSVIVFSVSASGLLSGNAVIARYKLDENGNKTNVIDWSWHLWFIPGLEVGGSDSILDLGDNEFTIGGIQNDEMPDKTTIMNRNLGVAFMVSSNNVTDVIQGAVDGLYYRQGYRTPYLIDTKKGGAYYGGLNPETDYLAWNSEEKSKTDPCPIGYRVPPITLWNAGTNANKVTKEHATVDFLGLSFEAFRYWDKDDNSFLGGDWFALNDIYYPFAGYVNSNGKVEKWIDDESTQTPSTHTFKSSVINPLPTYDGSSWSEDMQFFALEYIEVNMSLSGSLWAQSGGISYDATVPYKVLEYKYYKRKSRYSWNKSTEYKISVEKLKELEDSPYRDLLDRFLDEKNKKYDVNYYTNKSLDTKCGHQVRCVKE